jgi:LysR family nitrogen assimilation transcriptional regulator
VDSLDLRQIRCFVAAYEEGSFSKAAKREHCTQPGLSVYIKRLESALSHRRFDRTAQGVTPTVAGREFYASCADVLEALSSVKHRMLDISGNVTGSLNVGLPPALFKGALHTMLPEYMAAYPYIRVRLSEGFPDRFSDWFASEEIEVAVVSKFPADLGLKSTHYFRDRIVLVTRPEKIGKNTIQKQSPRHVRGRDLEKLKLALPSPKHRLRQLIDGSVQLRGGRVVEIDGVLGKLDLVRASDWATILPSIAVADEVREGTLVAKPICDPELWLDYFLVRPSHAVLSAPCRDFLHRLSETLERKRLWYPPTEGRAKIRLKSPEVPSK